MAILFVLIAGAFVALSNLFMRKSIDNGGTTRGFLVFQMFVGCGCSVLLEPVRSGQYAWNIPSAILGVLAGALLAGLLISLGKALEKGPAGLTFSILSGATVMPAIFMSLLFGASLGFPYTFWHGFGSLLVVSGLFWAGRSVENFQNAKSWIFLVLLMFAFHTALLSLFQYRAMLLGTRYVENLTSFFTVEQIKSTWFLPLMFFASGILQLALFLSKEKRKFKSQEMIFGVLGGAANGIGTFFLICSTQAATPLENAIIFPMYSIATIALSNFWSQKLYCEKINWRACQVCALGLLIATIDWKGLAAAIGL